MKMGIGSLFVNPADAIMQAKVSRNTGLSFVLLLLSAVFFAIGLGAEVGLSTMNAVAALVMFGVTFAVIFVFGLILSMLAPLAVRTLGGVGGFFEGITTVAYTIFLPSITTMIVLIVTAAAGLSDMRIVITTVSLAMVPLILWGVVLGMATLYRSVRELFQTDMITAYVAASVLIIGGVIIYYTLMRAYVALLLGGLAYAMPGVLPF
jgi:hypothetical protein